MDETSQQSDADLARGLRNLADGYAPSLGTLAAAHMRQCAARIEWLSQMLELTKPKT